MSAKKLPSIKEIEDLYNNTNYTVEEVAKKLGVCVPKMNQFLKDNNIEFRRVSGKRAKQYILGE